MAYEIGPIHLNIRTKDTLGTGPLALFQGCFYISRRFTVFSCSVIILLCSTRPSVLRKLILAVLQSFVRDNRGEGKGMTDPTYSENFMYSAVVSTLG